MEKEYSVVTKPYFIQLNLKRQPLPTQHMMMTFFILYHMKPRHRKNILFILLGVNDLSTFAN